ncbi:cytochrome-c peroxidase [Polyangium sorediatum]|uniref:Cytochrome c peroxidase n=1 Tax=Polyangium sorediatum TaxID=889274 RepID=A0ABT6NW92_9BACT|nr:cytochrome c peroxidase [Polyangium sorediatum]MDI1432607.1 cytochrome c peroxidase [Polyangium sorediatum]
MRFALFLPLLLVSAAAFAGAGCGEREATPLPFQQKKKGANAATEAAKLAELDLADMKNNFGTLPAKYEAKSGETDMNPITTEKVALGRMLYYDTRLSKNQDLSCNSCHLLDKFGVDGTKVSKGHRGQLGGRNAPTVYNAGAYVAQFWDGRAGTLEDQAKGPILNPVEMAMKDEASVVAVLETIPGYEDAFKKAFPDDKEPISYDNLAKAIGAFERQLVTPSRFDKYMAGDKTALTDQERAGLTKFVQNGCTSCHSGSSLGGSSFQKLGLIKAYPNQKDLGRYDVTKKDEDKMVFRVPTLRNVAQTGPWFHDGAFDRLETTVQAMAYHQLGKELPEADVADIVAFLKSLTGEIPLEYIKKPELPANGEKTPGPDPT